MRIESSFPHLEVQAPEILQEDTLEGIKWKTNSVPTAKLVFELQFIILKVENFISTTDGDDEEVLAKKDGRPKQRSSTFPTSLATLKMKQLLGRQPKP